MEEVYNDQPTIYLIKCILLRNKIHFSLKSNHKSYHTGGFAHNWRIVRWSRVCLRQSFALCQWPLSSYAGCPEVPDIAWRLSPTLYSGKPKAVPSECVDTLQSLALCYDDSKSLPETQVIRWLKLKKKKNPSGVSLVVQWLRRLHGSNTEGTGLIPDQTKIPHAVQCSQKKKILLE